MVKNIEIKDYFSSDIDNIWEWTPSDVQSIYFKLDVYIGEKEQDSSTIFSLIVSSPEALIDKITIQKPLWGRGYLIIKNYSFNKIEDTVSELIRKHSKGKKNVIEVFQSLDKELFWEYSNNVSD